MIERRTVADAAGAARLFADVLEEKQDVIVTRADIGDIVELINAISQHGFVIRRSNEGDYSMVAPGGAPGDFSRTGKEFDYHSDGLYLKELPRFVLLHCINAGAGICTTDLSDTTVAYQSLSETNKQIAQQLEGVYIGRTGEEYARPIVCLHPLTGRETLAFPSRGYFRPLGMNPAKGGHLTIRDIAEFTLALLHALDDATILRHSWTQSDILVFDNLRYIHARRCAGRLEDTTRRLHRLWFDFEATGTHELYCENR